MDVLEMREDITANQFTDNKMSIKEQCEQLYENKPDSPKMGLGWGMCLYVYHGICVWRSEDDFGDLVFFFPS